MQGLSAPVAAVAVVHLHFPIPVVEFDTRQTKGNEKELATTAPKVKTVSVTARRVASELDRIRESLLGPILAPSAPKVRDLKPALDDLAHVAEQAKRVEADIVVEVPAEFLQNLEGIHIALQVVSGAKAPLHPGRHSCGSGPAHEVR